MKKPVQRLGFMVRALRHRNYRLFFSGQIVSLCGTWMTNVATGWLVYRLTGSPLMLGVVTFAGQIPVFVLSPFAGALADRMDKRRGLVLTQFFSMLQSFALAALVFSGHASIAAIASLSLVQGLITSFDIPLRQSFLVEMVQDRDDLGNAIALNSSMFNAARLVGPSIGALVIAGVGEAWCFFIDGCSFIGVIASFLMMDVPAPVPVIRKHGVLSDLHEGWLTVSGAGPIRRIIMLLAVVSLLGASYMTLLPAFAASVLHGDAHTLGILMSSIGAGALIGAAWLAGRRSVLGLVKVIPNAAGIFGLSLAGLAFSRTLWLSSAFLVIAGCSLMVHVASSNTILQTIVDDDKRGRVMAFYTMAFVGTAPFGSLLMGRLSESTSLGFAIGLGGLSCSAAAAVFLSGLPGLKAAIRPIYLRMGILPPVTTASDTASRLTFETRD